jgi:hypothetical protein
MHRSSVLLLPSAAVFCLVSFFAATAYAQMPPQQQHYLYSRTRCWPRLPRGDRRDCESRKWFR